MEQQVCAARSTFQWPDASMVLHVVPCRSLGCVFYELTAQRPTFNAFNIHGLVSKIKKNKLAPLPSTYSTEWRDVVSL
jgi:hypothetical protein